MELTVLDSFWTVGVLVLLTLILTAFIWTLPEEYSNFQDNDIVDGDFTREDRKQPDRSGYAYYKNNRDAQGTLKVNVTVQVVVLGDIGRSPRMQNHALSIANHGGRVQLVGYVESDVHPDIHLNRLINVVPIKPFPERLQTNGKSLFLLTAPLKVLWQAWGLYHALAYGCTASKWLLVQNPPSIPTLVVSWFICFIRNTRLVIDWHNFGYSILALKLGSKHALVSISRSYEKLFSNRASAHFAVTDAMALHLSNNFGIKPLTLHDRPPKHFQPLNHQQRSEFLKSLPDTAPYASELAGGKRKLLVSSTSWTADEDFSILLDALVDYAAASQTGALPKLLVIITGKGPQKQHYLDRIQKLNEQEKLSNIDLKTAWLSTEDYARLLGSADLGISLHTSASGVDLPMKAVDMLGTGLPVLGWSKYEAWGELIHEGENGCGFESADGLAQLLKDLLGRNTKKLEQLRKGALKECDRRWDDEWMPVAGQLLQLNT
jgi:beta-1,4-mannosyltransferase